MFIGVGAQEKLTPLLNNKANKLSSAGTGLYTIHRRITNAVYSSVHVQRML